MKYCLEKLASVLRPSKICLCCIMKYDGVHYCAVIGKAAARTENLTLIDKLNCHAACITKGRAEERFTVSS